MRLDSAVRQLIPGGIKELIKKSGLYVKHASAFVNIYHCCVQRTGSQWIKSILSDIRTYRYSGLTTFAYQNTLPGRSDPRKLTERSFSEAFPSNTIVTQLYIDFENFKAIPKPKRYRAFFIMRDPRDLVVSAYFSNKQSHPIMGQEMARIREILNRASLTDGLLYMIQQRQDHGHFMALDSWIDAPKRDENVLLLKFEDLTGQASFHFFRQLFLHCDIPMREDELDKLLYAHSFKRLSGRKRGQEDKSAHYRKGVRGDWRNYFNDVVSAEFKKVTGNLLVRLGYENDSQW